MRNSQYFGLMWVLSSIAAAAIPHGVLAGVFALAAVCALGLAVYFLLGEQGMTENRGIGAWRKARAERAPEAEYVPPPPPAREAQPQAAPLPREALSGLEREIMDRPAVVSEIALSSPMDAFNAPWEWARRTLRGNGAG